MSVSLPFSRTQTWVILVGTRPEAIKMAALMLAAQEHPHITPRLISSGQHRQLATSALAEFSLTPDHDLGVMQHNQDLVGLTARILQGVGMVLQQERPDAVLVQGDTTTALAGALAAFYQQIPVYHIEAGLRSFRLDAPFPEEANRSMIARLARQHFAPTPSARDTLLREGIAAEHIHITGNTGIDALKHMQARLTDRFPGHGALLGSALIPITNGTPFIFVTAHRRETMGQGIVELCAALADIATQHPEVSLLFPVHPNPNIEAPVRQLLGNHPNIHLLAPLSYGQCIWLLERCRFVITDSGGLQEEATTLGKPLIVTRAVTERGEAIAQGAAHLTGTDTASITALARLLLEDALFYRSMVCSNSPFGDGQAAARITALIHDDLALTACERITS